MDQETLANAVNAEVQRKIGQMIIDQIAQQVEIKELKDRLEGLENKTKNP